MSNWTQLGSSLIGEAIGDNFGQSIAMSSDGTTVAVGAYLNDGAGMNAGSVRVFKWNGTAWNQLGGDIDGAAAQDRFGTSVALSADGTVLAVGANQNDGASGNASDNRGHVRIYIWDVGTSTWTLDNTFVGETTGDRFGVRVALSANGRIVAIGANFNDLSGADSGRVYVYYKDISDNWALRGSSIGGLTTNSFLGTSVALSSDGNIVAMGATGYDNNNGYVQVMEWDNNTSNWVQKGSTIVGVNTLELNFPLNEPMTSTDHRPLLGNSVALSSNGLILAIGAIRDTSGGVVYPVWESGCVYVYEWVANAWSLRGPLISGVATGEEFSRSIDLSADGNILAVGADLNATAAANAGQVRIFQWSGSSWVQLGSSLNGEADPNFFGISVALSSDGSIVASGATADFSYKGKVRVFSYPLTVPCLPVGTRVLTAAGYKAVEELAQDDLIVTSEGQAVPFRVYTTDISVTTEKSAPYLIPANIFGKFPVKDLTLSPNHAFQSRPGIWQIPQYAAMMNPAIRQIGIGKPVTYYHIETPDYFKDNLVVEGTVVESFAHKQLRKGEIVYSYSPRYNGFIRSQAARQMQARLTKS